MGLCPHCVETLVLVQLFHLRSAESGLYIDGWHLGITRYYNLGYASGLRVYSTEMENKEPSSNSCKVCRIHLLLYITPGIYEFSSWLPSDGLLSRPENNDYLKNICTIQEYFLGLCNQRIFEKNIQIKQIKQIKIFCHHSSSDILHWLFYFSYLYWSSWKRKPVFSHTLKKNKGCLQIADTNFFFSLAYKNSKLNVSFVRIMCKQMYIYINLVF